jgi:hypothetical protein
LMNVIIRYHGKITNIEHPFNPVHDRLGLYLITKS